MLNARELDQDTYDNRTLIWYQSLEILLIVNNFALKYLEAIELN